MGGRVNFDSYFEEDIRDSDLEEELDESMDGDAASALSSVGWGTDEDYGYYGEFD